MVTLKRILLLVIFICITGMGSALSLKVAIGANSWDAFTQSISLVSGIQAGTVGMLFNCLFVVSQILLLRASFRPLQLLQIPVSILLGSVVNFFLYTVFSDFEIENYLLRLLFLIATYIVLAFATAMVVSLNIVSFAAEGLCMAIAQKFKLNFGTLRQGFDVVCIAVAVLLTLLYGIQLTIREGSIIGMLLVGPLMGRFVDWMPMILTRLGVYKKTIPPMN